MREELLDLAREVAAEDANWEVTDLDVISTGLSEEAGGDGELAFSDSDSDISSVNVGTF
jgi:hypothetical protein